MRCGQHTLSSISLDLPTLLAVDGVREARTGREVVEMVRDPIDARSAGAPARPGLSAPLAVRAVVAAGGLLTGDRALVLLLTVRTCPSAGRVVGAVAVRAAVGAGVGRAAVVAGRTGGLAAVAVVEAKLARARAVVGAGGLTAGLRGVVELPAKGLRAAGAGRAAEGDLTGDADVVGPGAGSGASTDASALSDFAGGPGVAASSVATRECASVAAMSTRVQAGDASCGQRSAKQRGSASRDERDDRLDHTGLFRPGSFARPLGSPPEHSAAWRTLCDQRSS